MRNRDAWKRPRSSPPLPDDLIYEILILLPPKTSSRLRSVCRRWLSVATQTEFALAHASRARTSGFFLFTSQHQRAEHIPLDTGSSIPDPFLSFLDHDGRPPQFLDSCNGLVLLRKPLRLSHRGEKPAALAVVNPLTGAHHLIPTSLEIASKDLYLAFDPFVSLHFRVVSISIQGRSYPQPADDEVFIYSSETQAWRLLTSEFRKKCNNFTSRRSAHWNGCLVWENCKLGILCWDIRTEQFKWLPLPSIQGDYLCRYFGESGGRLHYITQPVVRTNRSIICFDLLEFKPDASGWFVLHKIDLGCVKSVYPEVNARVSLYNQPALNVAIRVLCFLRDDSSAGDRLLLMVPRTIVCFYLRSNSFTTVCSGLPDLSREMYISQQFYPHTHLLLPPSFKPCVSASCQDWIYWDRAQDKLLMDLMVEYSLNGQRTGGGFRIGAWREMVVKLNAWTQLTLNVNHLKNRLMSYKRDYRVVSNILMTGAFSWDPNQQMVTGGDAAWRGQLRVGYNASYYRRRKVPFKTLEVICGSVPANRQAASTKLDSRCSVGNLNKHDSMQKDPSVLQNVDKVIVSSGIPGVLGDKTMNLMLFHKQLEELNSGEDIDDKNSILVEEYSQFIPVDKWF